MTTEQTEPPPPKSKLQSKPPQATVNGAPVDPTTPALRGGGGNSNQRRRRGGGGRGRGRGGEGGRRGRGRGSISGEQSSSGRDGERAENQPNGQGENDGDGGANDDNKKGNNGRRRGRRRGRGGGGRGRGNENAADAVTSAADGEGGQSTQHHQQQQQQDSSPPSPGTEQALAFINDAVATAAESNGNANANGNGNKARQRNKKNGNKKKKNDRGSSDDPNQETAASAPTSQSSQQQQSQKEIAEAKQKKKKKRSSRRKKKANALLPRSQRPWLDALPPGADDPISLDPLDELNYPPFVICVEPPYVAILPGMWPVRKEEEITAMLSKDVTGIGDDADGAAALTPLMRATSIKPANAAGGGSNNGEDRELQVLKEQWGHHGVAAAAQTKEDKKANSAIDATNNNNTDPTKNPLQGRKHFHLFDGRVLAYYLVSTLQFIDPYNRRDLTRPELTALDAYLAHHDLGNAGVVEAYDETGRTMSTAGAAAQSAGGRAEILQQEARAIMNSLYGRNNGGGGQGQQQQQQQAGSRRQRREDEQHVQTNDFQRMYNAQQGGRGNGRNSNAAGTSYYNADRPPSDVGIYGDGGDTGGFVLIDDDINPGLRSGMPGDDGPTAAGPGTLYSARHIAERHSHEVQARDGNFPSLAATTTTTTSESANNGTTNNAASKKAQQPAPANKSLLKISNLVKKTDPKMVERQRKAREEAQRRAEMSKLSFFNPETHHQTGSMLSVNQMTSNNLLTAPTATANNAPHSEGVLERNRNLAMALGVAPSTVRNSAPALTGWARPVAPGAAATLSAIDEFGNELSAAQYPDALLSEAKERMAELLKLEKQWKKFLADDRAASCSLKPMNRPFRKFVHDYSDHWRLHTESFDPEGRRYVHCAKLVDTRAPGPLLSDAARRWRGPAGVPSAGVVDLGALPTGPSASRPASGDNASVPSDGWHTERRVPLKLVPRTVAAVDISGSDNRNGGKTTGAVAPSPSMTASTMGGMTRSTSTPLLSMTGERPPPPRFAGLCEKERPRLELAKRSIPTWDELESRNITQEEWNAMTAELQDGILKDIEAEEIKMRAQAEREREKEAARVYRLENREKKKKATEVKQRAILESAFASSSDDDSDGSDWFEGDLVFDGSDDEGM